MFSLYFPLRGILVEINPWWQVPEIQLMINNDEKHSRDLILLIPWGAKMNSGLRCLANKFIHRWFYELQLIGQIPLAAYFVRINKLWIFFTKLRDKKLKEDGASWHKRIIRHSDISDYKYIFLRTQQNSLIHVWSMTVLVLHQQSWVFVTQNIGLEKPKIFTLWPFTEKAWRPCWSIRHTEFQLNAWDLRPSPWSVTC